MVPIRMGSESVQSVKATGRRKVLITCHVYAVATGNWTERRTFLRFGSQCYASNKQIKT